jgi:hypothetical protein
MTDAVRIGNAEESARYLVVRVWIVRLGRIAQCVQRESLMKMFLLRRSAPAQYWLDLC